MSKVFDYLSILTLVLTSWVLFTFPFDGYLFYIIILMMLPVFVLIDRSRSISLSYFLFIGGLVTLNILSIVLKGNPPAVFVKHIIGIGVTSYFYYLFIKRNNFDINYIFNLYLKIAFVVSLIGITQFISFLIGFELGYNFEWIFNKWRLTFEGNFVRINSILMEPAHYVRFLSPAIFLSIHNLLFKPRYINRIQSVFFILSMLISFSSLGYFTILMSIVILLLNYLTIGRLVMSSLVLYFVFIGIYNNVEGVNYRVNSVAKVVSGGSIEGREIDLSTFTLYNNLNISLSSLQENPLIGSGLGSYPRQFDKYSIIKTGIEGEYQQELNKFDGNSLLFRTMTEMGGIGLFCIFLFIWINYVKKNQKINSEHWVLSNSILLLFILILIRSGHYFIYGLPLFVWIYYYNKKDYERLMKSIRDEA